MTAVINLPLWLGFVAAFGLGVIAGVFFMALACAADDKRD